MTSSRKLDRVFWLAGVLLALALVAVQSVYRIERVRFIGDLGARPADVAAIPGVHARDVVLPSASVDANWWVMHTEAMLAAGEWRVRATTRDDSPAGREVHWSSGLMWVLAGLAWLIHLASGRATIDCVQHAAIIAGPLMFAGVILAFALGAGRRWGGRVGGGLALALATSAPLDDFFRAGEADHHGIVAGFALACVLAALAAGAGRVAEPGREAEAAPFAPGRAAARRWMIASGLFGAAGLWVSAATIVPVLAGLVAGALLAAWLSRRTPATAATRAAPELWRVWGRAGAVGSLAFYLLEYAPDHLGWRLEVNHPLFALAWWGGAEVLSALASRLGGGPLAPDGRSRLRLIAGIVATAVLPAVILLAGTTVFVLRDAFLWRLHEDYIHEFRPLITVFGAAGFWPVVAVVQPWFLIAPFAFWRAWRRPAGPETPALVLAMAAAVPTSLLAFGQVRWFGVAQTVWLALAVAAFLAFRVAGPLRSHTARLGVVVLVVLGFLAYPWRSARAWRLPRGDNRVITPEDSALLVMRDVAWKIRRSRGDGPVNILSGPTTSTNLAFFGDFRCVGTLYWENIAGLKDAAAIYGATDEAEALRLCQAHGITHIVIFSWDVFAQPYARLHHARPKNASTDDCFVSGLLTTKGLPAWLRPLPYTINQSIGLAGQWLHIFEVRPDQAPAEALYHLGVYLKGVKRDEEGLDALIRSWNLNSSRAATGLALGRALIEAGRFDETRRLAAGLPAPDRLALEFGAGRSLARAGRPVEAVAALRAALALAPTNREIITDLAWLLATANDASARDGAEALRLIGALGAGGQSMNLREVDALAAAYAESGDFDQALGIVEKALAIATRQQNADALADFESRRESYRRREPFRLKFPSTATQSQPETTPAEPPTSTGGEPADEAVIEPSPPPAATPAPASAESSADPASAAPPPNSPVAAP